VRQLLSKSFFLIAFEKEGGAAPPNCSVGLDGSAAARRRCGRRRRDAGLLASFLETDG